VVLVTYLKFEVNSGNALLSLCVSRTKASPNSVWSYPALLQIFNHLIGQIKVAFQLGTRPLQEYTCSAQGHQSPDAPHKPPESQPDTHAHLGQPACSVLVSHVGQSVALCTAVTQGQQVTQSKARG